MTGSLLVSFFFAMSSHVGSINRSITIADNNGSGSKWRITGGISFGTGATVVGPLSRVNGTIWHRAGPLGKIRLCTTPLNNCRFSNQTLKSPTKCRTFLCGTVSGQSVCRSRSILGGA